MIPDLPIDVWLYTVQFIPEDELDRLLSLNSLFFHLVMQKRYREVFIDYMNAKAMRRLSRLKDPFVAQLARVLHMRLSFPLPVQSRVSPSRPTTPTLHERVRSVVNYFMGYWLPSEKSQPSPPTNVPSLDEVASIFPALVNLDEFTVFFSNVPDLIDMVPFFASAWTTFGHRLRKLSLGGDLDGFKRFLLTQPDLSSLEELSLEFPRQFSENTNSASILVDHVAPFTNRLASQLRFLRIWCWMDVGISSYLKLLGPFPNLQTISCMGPFNRAFLDDGTGIFHFLTQTQQLQNLELRLNPAGVRINPLAESQLVRWLSDCASTSKVFNNLQSLQLYPTNRPEGMNVMLKCVQQSLHSLTALSIRDRYLHTEEIRTLATALKDSTELTFLRMNVWMMNIELFDVLSHALPHLRRLSLYLSDVGSFPADTGELQEMLQEREYTEWKLVDFGIWCGGHELDIDTMKAIAQRIPTVKSFWGGGEHSIFPVLYGNPFP
ncbi:hypothetical protein AMATHDRAFT_64673 [Amanita thiersii Skay4041]|uniref:F-box domain-containing protein n=1 Tax=Amanita thiersii Skay4041 TaxID=703135 RepID=A0A2A9NKG5_9AGAR|nr:hypothetical protein AMATHDRAFT_64673 [Amanita thiersii Skay4041]